MTSPISYPYDPTPPKAQAKTPTDVLDYTLSWIEEFGAEGGSPGDSIGAILGITVQPSGSLTATSAAIVLGNQAVMFWASSGTPGMTYIVGISISTYGNRTYTRDLLIPVASEV